MKGNIKEETKSLFITAQNNHIISNYIKEKVDYALQDSK